METDQEVIGRLAERRCALAMKALLGAAEVADEISVKEFPAEAPVQLCRMLEGVARIATQRIPKLSAEKPEHAVSQADLLSLLAREITNHLRYAERAITLETPWSMVETVEEFGQKVYGSPVSFIVRPKWSYNYSLVGEFAGYCLHKVQTLFPQSDPSELMAAHGAIYAKAIQAPIHAISFPRLEKSNTLLHACFAHELGHFVSSEWVRTKLPTSGLLDKLRQRLLKYVKEHTKDPLQIGLRLGDLELEARMVLERLLEELLADFAAVFLLGPCVPFAMSHIATKGALTDRPSKRNDYYPPWGYRLHEMFRIAHKDVFLEAATLLEGNGFEKASTLAQEFLRQVEQFIGTKEASLELEAWPAEIRYPYEVIGGDLPKLEDWVRNRIREVAYSGEAHHLAQLCRDIEAGIPPLFIQGEREVPTDFRDILNAGWLYLITRVNETMDSLTNEAKKYRTQRRRLDLLVLKAIESSYLLEHHIPPEPGSTP